MGEQATVQLTAAKALNTLVPTGTTDRKVEAEVIYDGPLKAPVMAGDQVGKLIIRPEGLAATEVPLIAAKTVEQGGVMVRLKTASQRVVKKLMAEAEGAL